MIGRKPKFVGRRTKWEKKRIARNVKRVQAGKKPVVGLLTIAPQQERTEALKRGRMAFYNGKERLEVPLFFREGIIDFSFQGLYKVGKRIFGFYLMPRSSPHIITVMEINPTKGLGRPDADAKLGFFSVLPELGHMLWAGQFLKGRGLALKGASKAERHVRARSEGRHSFTSFEVFEPIFNRLKYETIFHKPKYDIFEKEAGYVVLQKVGKLQEKDDLTKWHVIEAIDPKTGKARLFRFRIQ